MLFRGDIKKGITPPKKHKNRKKRSTPEKSRSIRIHRGKGTVHGRSSRKRISTTDADPKSFVPHKRVPRQFESFTTFTFPKFSSDTGKKSKRLVKTSDSNDNIPKIISTDEGVGLGRGIKLINNNNHHHNNKRPRIHPEEEDTLTESQRFFPTFGPGRTRNNRHRPVSFFSSAPNQPGPPSTRGGRGKSSFSGQGLRGFRDFHETFSLRPSHGQGTREAIHTFNYAFPAHRNNIVHNSVDNSLLGSGNFEVLTGGTFYDEDDDLHLNHHPYDHFVDNSYVVFPAGHKKPPSSNHVDDFFSNFRDFSEFAVRRSGSSDGYFGEDEDYFGPGYGSEHVYKISNPDGSSDVNKNTDVKKLNKENKSNITNKKEKIKKSTKKNHIHKIPKNIQDVIADENPAPSASLNSILSIEERDPLIATF